MLTLGRHLYETVVISAWDPDGNPVEIVVAVVDLRRDKVRLGFTAPPSIRIDRSEIHDSIRRNGFRPHNP